MKYSINLEIIAISSELLLLLCSGCDPLVRDRLLQGYLLQSVSLPCSDSGSARGTAAMLLVVTERDVGCVWLLLVFVVIVVVAIVAVVAVVSVILAVMGFVAAFPLLLPYGHRN